MQMHYRHCNPDVQDDQIGNSQAYRSVQLGINKALADLYIACATKKDPFYSAMLSDIADPKEFCKFWFLE